MDEFISLKNGDRNYLIRKSAIVAVGDEEGYDKCIVSVNIGSEKQVYFVEDTIKQIQDKLEGFEGYDINN